jgi:hypothetical protein
LAAVSSNRRDQRFPHDPTTDQLYTDQRFEAYRSLGIHAARSALDLKAQDARTSAARAAAAGDGSGGLPAGQPDAQTRLSASSPSTQQ